MGEVEIIEASKELFIYSNIITYGGGADETITQRIREEIERMWNEPQVQVPLKNDRYHVRFIITASMQKDISEIAVYENDDPRNNYFRIEEEVLGNISFVDGLGSNSGYFKVENLYAGSTTAAHEYGHTLGLDHPQNTDLRGKGIPGIMYPRGTLVEPQFQYDPLKPAGVTGGTMHPMHRRVQPADIVALKLHRLRFKNNKAVIGDFTNVYHFNHADYPFNG
ncbi:MAG: peptidase M10 [Chitinophagaceae bacterium]